MTAVRRGAPMREVDGQEQPADHDVATGATGGIPPGQASSTRRSQADSTGGRPGTGKTTLGTALADATGWSLLHSDEVRRDLGRNTGPAPYGAAGYSDESVTATYRELLARVRIALQLGEPVVLDASWRQERWRELARDVAAETSSDGVELVCEVPDVVAAARVGARRAAGPDLSDATPATVAAMATDFDAWPEAIRIDTGGTPADSVRSAEAAVGVADAARHRGPDRGTIVACAARAARSSRRRRGCWHLS
jgi:predicted kinase